MPDPVAAANANAAGDHRIRVLIQQPALPKYRVPVMRELASRPGLDVRVVYSQVPGLGNATPEGFAGDFVDHRSVRIARRRLLWHTPQWRYATRAATDVLVLSWNLHYASLIPALLRARANGVPTILWGHGYSKQEAAWRAWPRQQVARLATALLFYNHTTANAYLKRGWDPNHIFVALNALDQTPIQTARQHWLDHPEALQQFQADQHLTPAPGTTTGTFGTSPVILFVSRFEHANRIDLLIRATAQLRQQHPGLQTIIIGKGEPEETRLKQLVAELGLTQCVRFPGAIYDELQLAPWFLSANAFCYPANLGLSVLHAFGYGLPVITSDDIASQNPEIEAVQHQINGLLYKHGDTAALTAALDQLCSNPAITRQMGEAAHKTATERFTLTNMVDGMEAAIRYCAATKPKQSRS